MEICLTYKYSTPRSKYTNIRTIFSTLRLYTVFSHSRVSHENPQRADFYLPPNLSDKNFHKYPHSVNELMSRVWNENGTLTIKGVP